MTGLVLGVDGGASKTVALVADLDGTIVGAGRAGNADIYQTPDAVRNVAAAIVAATTAAGAAPADLDAAALCLVGADWSEDFAHWRAALGTLGLGHLAPDGVQIHNDALGALAAGASEGPAVAIVCGTGTAVGARGVEGQIWHSSFWQRTQGAVELSQRALDAVYLADLGIGPATALTPRALAHFGTRDVEALLHAFTGRNRVRPRPGPFAPCLLDVAAEGDSVARAIVASHAEALAGYGIAAARRVGLAPDHPFDLVLKGGVFRHRCDLMRVPIVARMRGALPGLSIVGSGPEPVAGALLLALSARGIPADASLRQRLTRTMPVPRFFHTGQPEPANA